MTDSVYFVSLGCPKNLVDSQVMLGTLEKDRFEITNDPEAAKIIIVNTCSFIQSAKEESIDTILEMADYKQTGACETLVVSGCLAQRYSEQLQKEMPEIDLIIGTGQYQNIVEYLQREPKNTGELPARVYVDQPAFIHTENSPRMSTGPKHSAYLKLSEGCNRRCAFCIIPKLRGNVRSRTVESLVSEANGLAKQGVKELNLVAQDLTEYGMEWKYRQNLEMLLPELCKVEGIEWIRLHYVYPDSFSDELVEIIAKEDKIVKYLDMPIQHTNDDVLERMNRRLRKEKLFALIAKLRERIPGIVFRTSIIVGFPGETEENFQELCNDLKTLSLDHVGVFRYSKEEGTKAASMEDQILPSVIRQRSKRLIQLLQNDWNEKSATMIGQKAIVLLEGRSEESDLLLEGRLPTQAQEIDGKVLINETPEGLTLSTGDLVEVEITEKYERDFVGRVTGVKTPFLGSKNERNTKLAYPA